MEMSQKKSDSDKDEAMQAEKLCLDKEEMTQSAIILRIRHGGGLGADEHDE